MPLQKLLRKKGLYVTLAALTGFCTHQTAKAVPPQLLSELGKMRMVGRLKLTSSTPTNAAAKAGTKMLAAALSGAAIVAMIGIAAVVWSAHPHIASQPQPDDSSAPPIKYIQILAATSLSNDKVTAFQPAPSDDAPITVEFATATAC